MRLIGQCICRKSSSASKRLLYEFSVINPNHKVAVSPYTPVTLASRDFNRSFSTSKTNLFFSMEAIKTKAYGATNSIFNGLAPMEIERFPP